MSSYSCVTSPNRAPVTIGNGHHGQTHRTLHRNRLIIYFLLHFLKDFQQILSPLDPVAGVLKLVAAGASAVCKHGLVVLNLLAGCYHVKI